MIMNRHVHELKVRRLLSLKFYCVASLFSMLCVELPTGGHCNAKLRPMEAPNFHPGSLSPSEQNPPVIEASSLGGYKEHNHGQSLS
jgi:hypothetical protein